MPNGSFACIAVKGRFVGAKSKDLRMLIFAYKKMVPSTKERERHSENCQNLKMILKKHARF